VGAALLVISIHCQIQAAAPTLATEEVTAVRVAVAGLPLVQEMPVQVAALGDILARVVEVMGIHLDQPPQVLVVAVVVAHKVFITVIAPMFPLAGLGAVAV